MGLIRTTCIFILAYFISVECISAQPVVFKDTSFSVQSAYQKTKKEFPFIQIVDTAVTEGVLAYKDITYINYGSRELKLNLYSQKCNSAIKLPGIVMIHGGGWRSGDKSHLIPLAVKLAKARYICATIEYRLSDEATFPAAVIDAKNAVRWLKKNSVNYGIDTNKVFILGCSSGGQLASLVGLSSDSSLFKDKNDISGFSSKAFGIINIDGLMDFLGKGSEEFDEIPDSKNPRAAHRWFGASQIERPDLWEMASGIKYINENSPPILFINSSKPRFHAGRDESVEILGKYGIFFEVHTIENTPHPFWLFHPWFERTSTIIENFLCTLR